jgi:chromosomal replication initiation ATPase DnaA
METELICKGVTLNVIAKSVAQYFNIEEKEIFKRCRQDDYIRYRCFYVGLAKHYNRTLDGVLFSNARIGMYAYTEHKIKKFDHATIMHTTKVFDNFMETDLVFRDRFLGILRLCESLRLDKAEIFSAKKKRLLDLITQATSQEELDIILL